MYNVIKDMCISSKATMSVKLGNSLTSTFSSDIGIYQGDILSPILFNLYINDFVTSLTSDDDPARLDESSISCLYADDIILISTSESGLQKSVDKLYSYCKEWDLEVNTDKTKIMVFNKHGKTISSNIKFNGRILDSTSTYKYLGVLLNINGSFTTAQLDLSHRGQKAAFKLKSMYKNASPNFNTNMHLFDHIIKPIMLYASDIWGHTYIKNGNLQLNSLSKDAIESCLLNFF